MGFSVFPISLSFTLNIQKVLLDSRWGHAPLNPSDAVEHNHLTQNLFHDKVLNSSCNWLNTVLRAENKIVIWGLNGCKCIDCEHSWQRGWSGSCCSSPSITRDGGVVTQITSLGRRSQFQKSELLFYWMPIGFVWFGFVLLYCSVSRDLSSREQVLNPCSLQ